MVRRESRAFASWSKQRPGGVRTILFEGLSRAVPALRWTTGASAKILSLRRLWWAAIVLLGVSAGAVSWTIWQLRNDAIEAAVTEAGNIATLLAGQLARSVQSIDVVLTELNRAARDSDLETHSGLRAAFNR